MKGVVGMQTLVQVICTKGTSLRDKISNHSRLEDSCLKVTERKWNARSRGWTKIHSTLPDRDGAINIEWDADICLLVCRVVTKRKGQPNLIIADFVDFLLSNFKTRIEAINIIPRWRNSIHLFVTDFSEYYSSIVWFGIIGMPRLSQSS